MYTTTVPTGELIRHLGDPGWVIFDCRHDLADTGAGRLAYLASHIPGARFLHLDEDLSAKATGKNGRHPLPDPRQFMLKLGAMGVGRGTQVVAYDAAGNMYAARLWWMLRWVGHEAGAVLDGGFSKWVKEARPTTADAPQISPRQFEGSVQRNWVDAGYVMSQLENPNIKLLDARSPERFRGIGETLDPVGGHIPGARNRFLKDNLDDGGCFKPAAELNQVFAGLAGQSPPGDVIHYCGSGVTACHNLLAMEIAGLKGSRLYPGSWSEWCADATRPIAKD